jgi:protein AroM
MKIGVVTIGQSPRPDVIGEMERILGKGYEILEKGALDDFTLEDVQKIKIEEGQGVLVTRMRDGTEIKITHDIVNPVIQKRITELEAEGVEMILLVCTGRFPEFKSNVLVVQPSNIIRGVTRAAIRKGRMASILPSMQQVGGSPREREEDGLVTYLDSASPYGPIEEVEKLGDRLAKQNVDLIVLNCMGFDQNHKRIIREKTGKPVLQSSAMVARALKELLS